jgi:ABC-2 type transport system permease protein
MLMWGFLQLYLTSSPAGVTRPAVPLSGAVLLWDILFRGQIGFSISFLEEMWSRNLGNLMMTPLRPAELVASLMVMSIVRVLIGMVPVTILALWFFGFNFWALGLAVPVFSEPDPDELVYRACRFRHGSKKAWARKDSPGA